MSKNPENNCNGIHFFIYKQLRSEMENRRVRREKAGFGAERNGLQADHF